MADRLPKTARLKVDLTIDVESKTVSGEGALWLDGQHIYGVRLTDADEPEVKETIEELEAAALEAGFVTDDPEGPDGDSLG